MNTVNAIDAVEAVGALEASKYKCSQLSLIFMTITMMTISLFLFTYSLSIFAKMIGSPEILVIICGYCLMFIIIDLMYIYYNKYNDVDTS